MRPEDGKKIYDSIEIPEELSAVVNKTISSQNKEELRMKYQKTGRKNTAVRFFRYAAATAAGLLVCMTIGLNTSEAFAMEMREVPVLGKLAQVLTVRSYHGREGDYEIDMEVPQIEKEQPALPEETVPVPAETAPIPAETTSVPEETAAEDAFTGDINAEIQKIVDDYMAQAKTEFEEYKEAFFATGGTEEEWGGRTMDITVDYEVKYQEGNRLSLELVTSKAWVAAQEERHYYNLDLKADSYLTLQELLGEDYIAKANESITRQIKERLQADESLSYFGYGPNGEEDKSMGIEGFTTISADTPFYLNDKGNVVIVFEKYEIAPGYMGYQEFEIE